MFSVKTLKRTKRQELQQCVLFLEVVTVWKFHDFSIIQILREINFRDFGSLKKAILTHLRALNFDFS